MISVYAEVTEPETPSTVLVAAQGPKVIFRSTIIEDKGQFVAATAHLIIWLGERRSDSYLAMNHTHLSGRVVVRGGSVQRIGVYEILENFVSIQPRLAVIPTSIHSINLDPSKSNLDCLHAASTI